MKKKIYTLGICNDETASACLYLDGNLISAASEERFSRKKYDSSFPIKSINFLLKENSIKLSRIDNISYSWSKGMSSDLKKLYDLRFDILKKNNTTAYKIFKQRYELEITRDKRKRNEFKRWAKLTLTKQQIKHLKIFYHHESHAASASLLSPFNKGLVITADGRGDFESLTVSLFDRKKLTPLKKIYSATSSDSLGYFYGRITGLLGFKPMAHEGKITGLAAYGNPKKALPLMKKMINVKEGKLVASLGNYYRPFFKPYSNVLIKEIKKYSKEDIAAAAQYHLEECLCKIANYYIKKFKLSQTSLMLAGGIFANVKANYALKCLKNIKEIYVQPQMGDGGLCLGAGALHLHEHRIKINPLKNVYLGPSINITNIKKMKKKFPAFDFIKINSVEKTICKDLFNNKVIGLVRGKMEFGPRSLCNRSIIYKTSDKTINDWLNKRMKRTEFMPFAPVIRNETAKKAFKEYSNKDISLNFMTSTIKCTKLFSKKCPAVTHIDNTARPQVIFKNTDFFLWKLLKEWENKSQEMSLVNTSFNSHGEPIICDEEDALKSLVSGIIDVLYLENVRIKKKHI